MFTTDSITRYWRRRVKTPPMRAWLFACLILTLMPVIVRAQSASIAAAKLELTDDGYQLEADIDLQLTTGMQEAVRKGVPLYFIVEFQLTRGRWYWLDQSVISATRGRRISYAPLTDQYRIAISGISQNVSSFEDVRRVLSRIRSWTVAEKGQLKPGEKYEAALRFRLDTSQLPKPFQLNVITSKEWSLASDWHRWNVTP
ncbi:MAG: DUF4390 domain-containing protein [Betaproteobacteria bacterium]|nr:DUF4390 domain-containing protein [Betaproteobacteria bacterium]